MKCCRLFLLIAVFAPAMGCTVAGSKPDTQASNRALEQANRNRRSNRTQSLSLEPDTGWTFSTGQEGDMFSFVTAYSDWVEEHPQVALLAVNFSRGEEARSQYLRAFAQENPKVSRAVIMHGTISDRGKKDTLTDFRDYLKNHPTLWQSLDHVKFYMDYEVDWEKASHRFGTFTLGVFGITG